MFTHKDIAMRSIFVINNVEHKRGLRVQNGELLLEELDGAERRTLTKFPFTKLLVLFIIGDYWCPVNLYGRPYKRRVLGKRIEGVASDGMP